MNQILINKYLCKFIFYFRDNCLWILNVSEIGNVWFFFIEKIIIVVIIYTFFIIHNQLIFEFDFLLTLLLIQIPWRIFIIFFQIIGIILSFNFIKFIYLVCFNILLIFLHLVIQIERLKRFFSRLNIFLG